MILVHNDFHVANGIFSLFEGLQAPDLDKEIAITGETGLNGEQPNGDAQKPDTNGSTHNIPVAMTNGESTSAKTNGTAVPVAN